MQISEWTRRPDVRRAYYRTWVLVFDPTIPDLVAADTLPAGVYPSWVRAEEKELIELALFDESPTGEIVLRLYRPRITGRPPTTR